MKMTGCCHEFVRAVIDKLLNILAYCHFPKMWTSDLVYESQQLDSISLVDIAVPAIIGTAKLQMELQLFSVIELPQYIFSLMIGMCGLKTLPENSSCF